MELSFFEGPEKKVEIVVDESFGSLRDLDESVWHQVVQRSRATILSRIRGERCDAYLLSESSLFVYDQNLVMITCGRTRLLDAIAEILQRVGHHRLRLLIYERKNEHFPERQSSTFYQDAKELARMVDGRAFRYGEEDDHRLFLFHSNAAFVPESDDTTLEILMHGISSQAQEQFSFSSTREMGAQGSKRRSVAEGVGLTSILPGFEIDEHEFKPKGYSLNAIRGDDYYTVHVTPEAVGSYVSFETNVDFRSDPASLIGPIVGFFEPRSFDLVTFVPQGSWEGRVLELPVEGYSPKNQVSNRLRCGYEVGFCHYFLIQEEPAQPFEIPL